MNRVKFSPFPLLQTEHFELKQLNDSDAKEILILRSDERVMKYLDHPKAESINDAFIFIQKVNSGIGKNESIYWAVKFTNSKKLVGTICLWNIAENPFKADLGFELLPDFWGKGIMQEVIPVVLDYGFSIMGLEKIYGEADRGNIKSIGLMKKFGFVFDKELEETVIYSIIRPDKY